MKCTEGFLGVATACIWMMILVQSTAGSALKKHAAEPPCSLRELTALTKHQVEDSLESFDEANGKDIGTWSPGFPELQVHQNASLNGSTVQCSLHFMAQGLEKILEDQENNLNPKDVSLHKKLRYTISNVKMLAACAESILEGKCTHNPTPPKMPKHAFERKQWSHTLLTSAKEYLDWLHHKIEVQIPKAANKNIQKHRKVSSRKYLVGSKHQL